MHGFKSSLVLGLALATGGAVAFAQDAAPDEAAQDVSVNEIIIATGVEEREPVGASESFSKGSSRLVCFVRAANRSGEDSAVLVSWERADGEPAEVARGVRLEVPTSTRYRTFVRGSANRDPGSYRCVVRNEAGAVLGQADFEITE